MKKISIRFFRMLLIAILASGLFPVKAAVVTHDISTGILNIAGTSTDDYIITGSTTNANYVVINSQYKGTITLRNLSITSNNATYSPITVLGEFNRSNRDPVTKVNVILEGTNTLMASGSNRPAFQVDQGAQIHLSAIDPSDDASGILNATAQNGGAGIGAPILGGVGQGTANLSDGTTYRSAGGNVIISSGKITAKGGHGAGIGGGYQHYYNGVIVIYGGEVFASAKSDAAGIGSGCPRGGGLRPEYATESAIIVLPPAKIEAQGSKPAWGVAGSASITYIGDPNKSLIKVQTEGQEKYADIYADLSETTSITSIFEAVGITKDLTNIKFGSTGSTGALEFRAQLEQNVTFFTDASSSAVATQGRPFKPVTTTATSAKTIELPLLKIGMSFEAIPAIPLEAGYTTAQAKTNAYKLKVTYTDSKPMTGISFGLQAGASTDFKGLTFYGSDGATETTAPTSLSSGTVFYVQVPLKDSKPLNVYKDVLRISGTFDGAPTGYIRQIITQRVVVDDTETNNYIKVTASPATFSTNNAATATATLTLNITHGALSASVPYNNMDVTARYLITTQPDYAQAIAATPLSSWTNLNVPASDGGNSTTTASFTGKPEGTYYIHWHVESGVIYAHSKTVVNPAAPYGGFGPYIIDTSGPTATLEVDGQNATKNITDLTALPVTLTFNEAIKNPGTDLAVSDFEILPAGIATLSGITVVPSSGDKEFTATLTPGTALYNGQSFTVQLKANAVTDPAGNNNTVSNMVTVNFSNNTKPTAVFNNAATYSSLRPTFTVEVSPQDFGLNANTDLYPTAGGTAIIAGANLNSLFVITPEGGAPLASGYTATYSKTGSGASGKGVVTITFTSDLLNSKNYTISLAADKFYNKLQNGNEAGSSTFLITLPDFTGGTAGINANPNLFTSTGGSTTLTIKGEGLKLNAENGILSLRVACPATGYNSGAITNGFTLESGMDVVTINGVPVPANTGATTQTYTFELYMTFNSTPETSTGKTCVVQVEPSTSYIVGVANTTSSVTDLTFGYTSAQAQLAASRQNITVTNNGAQPLNDLTVTFTGSDGSSFAYTSPSPVTGLAPGNTATFYVYLQAGKNAGTYAGGPAGSETKVSVSAKPGTSSTPISGNAILVAQKVNPKASTNNGLEGSVVGSPAPSTTWSNQNTVTLTASALETGDFVKDWKYAVSTTNAAPVPTDPAWTTISGGTTNATYTFPAGTDGERYIFWQMNTNNITGITGQVENSGVKEYKIDLVVPTVTGIVSERSVTNATPFKVTVTFSEPVSVTDASKFTATNATVGAPTGVGAPVNGQYTDYEMMVTPNTGLAMGSTIMFSVQANAVKDRANNNNPASGSIYDVHITFNNVNPLVTLTTPDLTVNSNFTVTVTFTKAVTGLTESDFSVTNGAIVASSLSGSGTTYTVTVNTAPSSSGYISFVIPDNVVVDAANNGNEGGALTVDYRDPSDRIAAVLSYSGPAYENGAFDVRVSFSRNVTGLAAGDFNYSSGDFGPPVLAGDGKNYVLTLTPLVNRDATTAVQLPAAISALDEYGNSLLASNIVSVNYDTRHPLVSTITAVGGITTVNFDPFTVEIVFDEPNLHSFDAGKLKLTGLDYLGLVSGPVTTGTTTKFEISVKVAAKLPPSGSTLTLQAEAGTARDKANNPNVAGAGSTPLSITFIDNVQPKVINVTPSNDWAPIKGNLIITFDEPINPASNGTVWLENFGTVKNGVWLNSTTYSLPYGYLANDYIYEIYISGYEDPAGNIMVPASTYFGTRAFNYPYILRPVILYVDNGLETSCVMGETIYINSQDDFIFTVSSEHGNLDDLTITTGIPLRDKEGIRMEKNSDGSITVKVLRVTEPLIITVSRGSVSNEMIESNKIWAHDQSLYIQTDQPGTLFIYTLSGALYKQMKIAENVTIPLETGFYTVVYNGISCKVIIE
jgi:hypothetical protein